MARLPAMIAAIMVLFITGLSAADATITGTVSISGNAGLYSREVPWDDPSVRHHWQYEWTNTAPFVGSGTLTVDGGGIPLTVVMTSVHLAYEGVVWCDGRVSGSGEGSWEFTYLLVPGSGQGEQTDEGPPGSYYTNGVSHGNFATFTVGPIPFFGTYGGGPDVPPWYDVRQGLPSTMTGHISFQGSVGPPPDPEPKLPPTPRLINFTAEAKLGPGVGYYHYIDNHEGCGGPPRFTTRNALFNSAIDADLELSPHAESLTL